MPRNRNDWAKHLLSWRGDDLGGVRVPFWGGGARDIDVVETPLIKKLRTLASGIAGGRPDLPRLIFLVGGPGNGKSQAVEDFLGALDNRFGLEGELVETLESEFKPDKVVPRVVEIDGRRLSGDKFGNEVGRLIVIHDASASNEPGQDAAARLVEELDNLRESSDGMLFICCINRGVLARAAVVASERGVESVARFLTQLIEVSSLTPTTEGKWPSCWPLEGAEEHLGASVACWPMDAASLFDIGGSEEDGDGHANPVEKILSSAVREDRWEREGRCADCSSSDLCPLRRNAEWLRNSDWRSSFLRILRLSELVSRQRWNFRNVLTLLVDTVIGSWDDFGSHDHPCDWVHETTGEARGEDGGNIQEQTLATIDLVYRLYPHALFSSGKINVLSERVQKEVGTNGREYSAAVLSEDWQERSRSSYVGEFLESEVIPYMDPGSHTPRDADSLLRQLENAYSRSIEIGNHNWPDATSAAPAERSLLEMIQTAEGEWDALERASGVASDAQGALRRLAAKLAKRSVAVRLGEHGAGGYLDDYATLIHDREELDDFVYELFDLFGHDREMLFDAVSTYGQARKEEEQLLLLRSPFPLEDIVPVPEGGEERPSHDLPFIRIAGEHLPITYDLYRALRLRQAGAPSGSLPPGVEAVMDRIRHIHAGAVCREDDRFRRREVEYVIRGIGRLVPTSEGRVRLRRTE